MGAEPSSNVVSSEPERLSVDWPRYRDNLARHLNGLARDLESRVMGALSRDLGFEGLRPSFGPLLSRVWEQGRPIGAVASELGISSQACGQLVDLVQAAGYLERQPNPADRRSRLVMLTARGRSLVEEAVRLILESEADYAALVGDDAYRSFTAALAKLHRGFALPTHADSELTARAQQSFGVLPLVAERVRRELMTALIDRGHTGLKMSHAQVLPLIGPEGGRIHEIARLEGVSRQAISATSQDLESLGYIHREPDPLDRRGVVLQLTDRGVGLIADSLAALDDLELVIRGMLGVRGLAQLGRVASDLYHALRLEAEIFRAADDPSAALAGIVESDARRGRPDIDVLAARLREWLGHEDAERLAARLDSRTRSTAT